MSEQEFFPVAPFVNRFYELQRMGVNTSLICRRLEWVKSKPDRVKPAAETQRLLRVLGLKTYNVGTIKGGTRCKHIFPPNPNKQVRKHTAKQLCDAMDIPYSDVGL
jgi:hypothetical protein